jgi:sec-independent protein translocase protein TatA
MIFKKWAPPALKNLARAVRGGACAVTRRREETLRMLSIPDMALLGAAALMFFGPEQLPKVARKVGLMVREVQNTSQSFIREMEMAADRPPYEPVIPPAVPAEEPPVVEHVAEPVRRTAAADHDLPP